MKKLSDYYWLLQAKPNNKIFEKFVAKYIHKKLKVKELLDQMEQMRKKKVD